MLYEMTDQEDEVMQAFWNNSVDPLLESRRYGEATSLLRARLATETGGAVRSYLLQHLSHLLIVDRRYDEALSVIHQRIDLEADDPIAWCSLAGWHVHWRRPGESDEQALDAALTAIDTAVVKAREHGCWHRYALNSRCRIAVEMKRYDLLADSMREILAIPPQRGVPDIRIEDDFLRALPEDAVDPELLAAYRAAFSEQAARRIHHRRRAD